MCNVLLIEDQQLTIEKYKNLAEGTSLTFFTPADVDLLELTVVQGTSVEEQLALHLKKQIAKLNIDLVMLDTDLSRERLQTHSSYKAALRELGMPVCRYQKGGTPSRLAQLPQLQRTIRDGATAIWLPRAIVSGDDLDQLVPRLIAISEGFNALHDGLVARPDFLEAQHSPTDVIAALLGEPEKSFEFLGYAAQNLMFFAKPEEDSLRYQISPSRRYATQLGYWLFNYIITFPGPILTEQAAAAYLNIDPVELESQADIKGIISAALYNGPFCRTGTYYWRYQLLELLDDCNGDIRQHDSLRGRNIKPVDTSNLGATAYICMISGDPISLEQAAVNPDWVPSGASESKIKEQVLDELGPLAGI